MMPYVLSRPPASFDPGNGLLIAEQFQMAYVTNDIERALALLGARLGIRQFTRLEGPFPEGGQIRAEFAWVGTLMYEVIQASGPGSAIFMDRFPQTDGFHLMHHHLGFLIHDREQWDRGLAAAERNGFAVPHRNSNPLVDVAFIDVPELGHYLEYLLPTQAGLDFFDSVPRH